MAGDIDFQAILESIPDERARHGFRLVLNLVEELVADNQALRELVQQQRDEINRLKGEQGKPRFKPDKPADVVAETSVEASSEDRSSDHSSDHSSEKERRKRKDWKKGSKLSQISADREQFLYVDPSTLPPDAVRKGYEEVLVQDLIVKTDNVLFHKEKWYSPGANKTFIAGLPPGYYGAFGPKLKALALSLSFGTNISQPKLLEFFRNAGVLISAGTLSNMLTEMQSSPQPAGQSSWQDEYDALFRAGLLSSVWQGTDHTSTSVKGVPHQCQVVGNSLYSIYATTPTNNRLSVLDVLLNRVHRDIPRTYLLNAEAEHYLDAFKFSGVIRRTLMEMPHEQVLSEPEFLNLLDERLPQLSEQQYNQVIDGAAIAAYHEQKEWPIVHLLLCDDAPVFKGITEELGLCWVHAGRHYKKLSPFIPLHRSQLAGFSEKLWAYYKELLLYKKHPTPEDRDRLSQKFDTLFNQTTEYAELDKRMALTRAKKESLLQVLQYPELPLHNNDCELSARARVRKRDVSFGPRTKAGVRAWDIFMSLYVTARKLGVSFYHYLYDRISQSYEMPSLAALIKQNTPDRIPAFDPAPA